MLRGAVWSLFGSGAPGRGRQGAAGAALVTQGWLQEWVRWQLRLWYCAAAAHLGCCHVHRPVARRLHGTCKLRMGHVRQVCQPLLDVHEAATAHTEASANDLSSQHVRSGCTAHGLVAMLLHTQAAKTKWVRLLERIGLKHHAFCSTAKTAKQHCCILKSRQQAP